VQIQKRIRRCPKAKIRKMILELIEMIDHDHWKQYRVESAEEPETVEERLQELIDIVKKYV
jgi:hypothetical protein